MATSGPFFVTALRTRFLAHLPDVAGNARQSLANFFRNGRRVGYSDWPTGNRFQRSETSFVFIAITLSFGNVFLPFSSCICLFSSLLFSIVALGFVTFVQTALCPRAKNIGDEYRRDAVYMSLRYVVVLSEFVIGPDVRRIASSIRHIDLSLSSPSRGRHRNRRVFANDVHVSVRCLPWKVRHLSENKAVTSAADSRPTFDVCHRDAQHRSGGPGFRE